MSYRQKCTGVVVYSHDKSMIRLHSISVTTANNHTIELYANNTDDCLYFESIRDAYEFTINTIRNNNFDMNYYISFNSYWYNLIWIDCDDREMHRFGLSCYNK